MKTIKTYRGVLAIPSVVLWVISAQAQGAASIQEKLESEYKVTKATDDKADIVTAGSVVALHKDNILMVAATTTGNPCMNAYRDGKVYPSRTCKVGSTIVKFPFGSHIPHVDKAPATRTFVEGERLWVTKIEVRDTGKEPGVLFDFFTDAIPANDQGIRYKGQLMIPFGALTPTPDEALKLVAEVITVVPPEEDAKKDGAKAPPAPQGSQQEVAPPSQPSAPAPAASAPVEAAPTPIAVPPPPTPDPTEVKEGQTIEQVVAALGQPLTKATVGTKDIYTYKGLKVTFFNGKVKDVD